VRHFIFIGVAALTLGACETMPAAFAQSGPASTTSAATSTNTTPAAFTPPPEQQLLELERQLSAASQTEGLGGALASAIHPEGMVIRPGVTLAGADEISRGLTAPAGAGPMYWQPDRVDVSGSGDMGMTSGRYVQVITGAEAQQGRYVVVWRRDGVGDWKILTETRIPDPPRAAPVRRR
jgi:ketosteroid isomerase-like protein